MGPGQIQSKKPVNPNLVSYDAYLKIPELLSLQKPLSKPVAHDELLFIITHQTYELWFKQVIFETQALISLVQKDELFTGFRLLGRISEIFRILVQQIDILETMTPVEFNQFRANLNPASGFQSAQFRKLEKMGGIKSDSDTETIPTLKSALLELLVQRRLLRVSQVGQDSEVKAALLKVYEERSSLDLYNLCEALIKFDEMFMLWRFRHVQMVERMIGMKMGTGGSLGVPYLQQTLKKRFFPELWEIRTEMSGATY